MTAEHEAEARAILSHCKLSELTDVVIAHDVSIANIKRLGVTVTAARSADEIHDGIVPSLDDISDLPAAVLEAARSVVREAVVQAIEHHTPKGKPS